jgi:4-hydroxy-3-methylbut-2-enyl diphosphate reductase
MEIIVSTNAGFCFGVRGAMDTVERELGRLGSVYTLGPLIHNRRLVNDLALRGVKIADSPGEVSKGDTVVIRCHGVGRDVIEDLERREVTVVDATCPCVKRIHRIVSEAAAEGHNVLVVGDAEHPEVQGVLGWSRGSGVAVPSEEAAAALPAMDSAVVVTQTTVPEGLFEAICRRISLKTARLNVVNTICSATAHRQREAIDIANRADVMLVVGSESSSNTRKLYDICASVCPRAYLIQEAGQIDGIAFEPGDIIGVTAGASTPDCTFKEVVTRMNDIENQGQVLETNSQALPDTEPQEAIEPVEALEQAEAEAADAGCCRAEAEAADAECWGAEPEAADAECCRAEPEAADAECCRAEPEAEPADEPDEAPPSEGEEIIDDDAEESQEPQDSSSDNDFMADIEKTLVKIHPGQTIIGTVVQITEDEVCVNVGYKADGLVKRADLVSQDIQVGDEIEVEVVKVNDGDGNVLLSQRNVISRKNWSTIVKAHEESAVVTGIGKNAVKGGLIADIAGVRAFIPASLLALKYVEKIEEFIGAEMSLKIIEIDNGKKRAVASRKAVLQEEELAKKREIWNNLVEGEVVKGIVRRITTFGAFVDIGGIDGLVHVTDLSWGRVNLPSDIVSVGDEIDVKILKIDSERERVSLSYKQTLPKPWDYAIEKYAPNNIVTGKIVRIVTYGAFVELEPGLDGMVHISQCALTRIAKVGDAVKVGDIIRAKVLSVDPEAKRISLSIREALEDMAFDGVEAMDMDGAVAHEEIVDEARELVDAEQDGAASFNEPVEEPVEEPAEELVDEPAEEPAEEAVDEPADDPEVQSEEV